MPTPLAQQAQALPNKDVPSHTLASTSGLPPRAVRRLAVSLLAASLAACGGGGGSSTSSPAATAPAPVASTPAPAPSPAPAPVSTAPTQQDMSRLADQATFGSNDATVAAINAVGESAWIDAQIATPPTGYPALTIVDSNSSIGCPMGAIPTCYRDNYTSFPIQHAFLANTMNGPDQLRQRVAWALSQIMVVSSTEISPAYAMGEYQQILLKDAFANYRTLLQDVTLSPAMGLFLNMVNNAKGNVHNNTHPNENYGREALQLFSIGLNKLNADGSVVLDASGQPVPTYSQIEVEGFAAAFTGWTYPPTPGVTSKFGNPQYFDGQMVPFASQHDTTAKTLLNGTTTAAGQLPYADLQTALDNIANHPNVGPFIGKQLIQFLTTSNPSPAYVSRISAVFNNNGKGVRGDLGAVVKAILLDPEARGTVASSSTFGKLREPVEFASGLMRQINGTSDGVALVSPVGSLGQNIFGAPSVFNYYPPGYPIPDSTLVGPQFGIVNTASTLNRVGLAYNLIYGNAVAPDTTIPGSIGTKVDLSSFSAIAGDAPTLVAKLNTTMMHNALTGDEIASLTNAVNSVKSTDPLDRARMAIFLIATSSAYQVKR